jgi:predicted enzyme related to lactoylglutathione lyase
MGRPVHFEIHADDPERACAFYRDVFGWTFTKWGGGGMDYWLITTGPKEQPGIDGGMLKRNGPPPAVDNPVSAFICTIDVPDIDETLSKATSRGGHMALPKQPVPGVGWLAYCKDTEGNIFGIMQADTAAQ